MLLQYRDVLTSQCNDLCQYIRVALSDGVLRGAQLSHWLAILEKTESALAREPDDLPGDVSHMGIVCVIDSLVPDMIGCEYAQWMKIVFRDQHAVTRLAFLPSEKLADQHNLKRHLRDEFKKDVQHAAEQHGLGPHPELQKENLISNLCNAGLKAMNLKKQWLPLIKLTASLHRFNSV